MNPAPPPRPPPPADKVVGELKRLLGDCVFMPCHGKAPHIKWKDLTLADMTPEYLATLPESNIGVLLGEVSGGLCSIDFDKDRFVQDFLALNPTLIDTFRTRGARGCQFWVRIKGDYPPFRKLGDGDGEWRTSKEGKHQSIVWGIHPDTGKPYQWLVRKPAIEVEYKAIAWPAGLTPTGNLPIGDLPIGVLPVARPTITMEEVGELEEVKDTGSSSVPVLADVANQDVSMAFGAGCQSTTRNYAASFNAVLTLIHMRQVDSLLSIPPREKQYLAQTWYNHLRTLGRIHGKPPSHYYNDMLSSIKNARRNMKSKNPIPQAWVLAQSNPLPPEASAYQDDPRMQSLIALCYQMDIATDHGEWFLSRATLSKLMKLNATDTRSLTESFNVLIAFGLLEVVTPYDRLSHKATIYRWNGQRTQSQDTERPA